jgi:hypothetical protein
MCPGKANKKDTFLFFPVNGSHLRGAMLTLGPDVQGTTSLKWTESAFSHFVCLPNFNSLPPWAYPEVALGEHSTLDFWAIVATSGYKFSEHPSITVSAQAGVVAHTHNPSTGKSEEGVPQVQGQPGLHSESLFWLKKT